jgi:hypothetical protein
MYSFTLSIYNINKKYSTINSLFKSQNESYTKCNMTYKLPLLLKYTSPVHISIRNMQRASTITRLLGNSNLQKNSTKFLRESYAVHRAHTPDPTTNSQEGIKNNPIFTLFRKKGSIVGQHTEWVYQECKEPECAGYVCSNVCGEPKGPEKSIGHFTHSKEKATGQLSEDDLDGVNREQFACLYEQPHETTSITRDTEKDQKKTDKLFNTLSKKTDDNDYSE